MVYDLFRGPTPDHLQPDVIGASRHTRGENLSFCFGCGQVLQYADSHCPCEDANKIKANAVYEKWKAENPNGPPPAGEGLRNGFVCFESVMPMRGSLKAISRLRF